MFYTGNVPEKKIENLSFFFACFQNVLQCSKLRVHPAPCVHDFNAGCMIFKAVHPVCAPFSLLFSVYLSLCAHDLHSGCTHFPTSAPGKCTHLNLNFEHCIVFFLTGKVLFAIFPDFPVRMMCQYDVTGWVSMWAYDMLSQ